MEVAALGLEVRSDGLVTGTKRLRDLEGQSRRTETSTERMVKSAMRAAGAFAAMAAATMGFTAVISTLSGFETSMAAVAAITRATEAELAQLRDTAKDLGATTEFTASQAADALKFLGMAGWSAAQSMAAIPAVLDLATAAQMDLASAADITSNIMSGFGLSAASATKVADVLAAASSRANTDVMQLGSAMSTVAPIAAALGIDLADTAAAIGIMSDAGIQGERAGTAMRGVLASLAGPTTQAAEVLAKLGLTVNDVNPATNDLSVVLGRLRDQGVSTADAMALFGREAASGALVLISSADKVGKFGAELEAADGEVKRMAETMRDQLGGDIKGLQSALEGLIIQLGESGLTAMLRGLIQTMTAMARGVTGVMQSFSSFAASIDSVIGVSSTLGGAISLLVDNMDVLMAAGIATAAFFAGKLALSLGATMVQAATAGAGSLLMYSVSLGATSTASAIAAVSMQALRVAISVMLGPVGIAIALIGALTAAIVMNGRETARQREIQERYTAILDNANKAAETARKRLEDFRKKTGEVSDKVDEAAGKVRGFTDALNGLSANAMFSWLAEMNKEFGLYSQILTQVSKRQSDMGMEGVALLQAQSSMARALTDQITEREKATHSLREAEKQLADAQQRYEDSNFDPRRRALVDTYTRAVTEATAAVFQHNNAIEAINRLGVDGFAGDLWNEQEAAAQASAEKVQEMITGLRQQLLIDSQINDLQKEIVSNLLSAGLAANDNSISAQQIRDLTKELYDLDVSRTREAENLARAKKGAESLAGIENEIRQLKSLNEALMISDEHHMALAYSIGLENAMREAGIDALDAYGLAFAKAYAERDRVLREYETRKGSAGGTDVLSETDRTSITDRFKDLQGDIISRDDNPASRLENQYLRELDIIKQYEALKTENVAAADAERLVLKQQYEEAMLRLQLSSGEQAAGALASSFQQMFGEQSAAYKMMFGIQQAFVIATASLNIAKAMSEALALPFPANLAAWGIVMTNAATIMSAVNSVALGFQAGGYTGSGGVSQVAGVVHGQEFVAHAEATRRWRPQLEAMNSGTYRPANDNGGGGLSVTIENHAPGVRHEVQQIDEKTYRIIAREEAMKAAPDAVAGAMAEPNSKVSKAMKNNFTADRRRA